MHNRTLIASLALLLVAGCKTGPQVRKSGEPAVTASRIQVTEQTMSSFALAFHATVSNPHTGPLDLDGLKYTLKAGGKVLRTGTAKLDVEAPPDGEGSIDVPIAVEYALTEKEIEGLAGSDTIDLLLSGTLEGHYGSSKVELPIQRAGALRAPRLPTVSFGTPDAARQSLEAISATFPIQIHNDNPFPVKIGSLDYQLTVEGNDMDSGMLAARISIPPSSTQVYEVAADLTEKTVPGLKKKLKAKNELDYHLSGTLHVGAIDLPVDLSSKITFTAERK